MTLFGNKDLLYEGRKSELSEEQIKGLFKEEFPGIEDFINLYLTYDGIRFSRQAMMFRNRFYNVSKGDWDEIDVGFFMKFNHIVELIEIKKRNFPELQTFTSTHVPFADDGCGNSIWIETPSGHIKQLQHEYELDEGLIIIAPGFKDFCAALENWKLLIP